MTDRSKLIRSGSRALTGFVITGIAAAGALALNTVQIPDVVRDAHAISVDTTLSGEHTVVCSGAFVELGADPTRPDAVTAVGQANLFANTITAKTLVADGGTSGGEVFAAPIGEGLAAVQMQQLQTDTLWGMSASNCAEPANEQWLLGGSSTLGNSTTLTIGNASEVPATVGITVFDENGEVAGFQTAGVIVAPNGQQTVSLNGYAPDRERLAVRVTSTGAPVTAVLGVAAIDGLNPIGVATVTRQVRPETHVVIPGIANSDDHTPGETPGDAGHGDRFPVVVQALSTSDRDAIAHVAAIDGNGVHTDLGTIELKPRAIGSLQVESWPRDATAVVIEAEVPVYAGAYGTSNDGSSRDFDWFAPAPQLPADTEVAAPVAAGGRLILVNTSNAAATVRIGGTDESDVTVAAGSAVSVKASPDATIMSTLPIYAGVRLLGKGTLAGYPVLPPAAEGGELTVYTR